MIKEISDLIIDMLSGLYDKGKGNTDDEKENSRFLKSAENKIIIDIKMTCIQALKEIYYFDLDHSILRVLKETYETLYKNSKFYKNMIMSCETNDNDSDYNQELQTILKNKLQLQYFIEREQKHDNLLLNYRDHKLLLILIDLMK
jgi:CRISPR-associated protein Cas8b1/Cst1 subtype I-B